MNDAAGHEFNAVSHKGPCSAVVSSILDAAQSPVLSEAQHGVTQGETKAWLEAFAKGVRYVEETYGTAFARFAICNRVQGAWGIRDDIIMYDGDNDTAVVTRGFIAKEITTMRNPAAIAENAHFPGCFVFTGLQHATLLGVEEAFHAYQFKKCSGSYAPEDWNSNFADVHKSGSTHYQTNRVERDATAALAKAIDDLHFSRPSIGAGGHEAVSTARPGP